MRLNILWLAIVFNVIASCENTNQNTDESKINSTFDKIEDIRKKARETKQELDDLNLKKDDLTYHVGDSSILNEELSFAFDSDTLD